MKRLPHQANTVWLVLTMLFLKIAEEFAPEYTRLWWITAAFLTSTYYCVAVWREDRYLASLEEEPVGRLLQRVKEVRILKWVALLFPPVVLSVLYRLYLA